MASLTVTRTDADKPGQQTALRTQAANLPLLDVRMNEDQMRTWGHCAGATHHRTEKTEVRRLAVLSQIDVRPSVLTAGDWNLFQAL